MDKYSSYGYSWDESRKLSSDFYKNNSRFTSASNQHYNSTPVPYKIRGKSNWEGHDFTSYAALDYINKMLLEEDIDEKCCAYDDEAALHATEKTFYDVLGQKYPSLSGKTADISPEHIEILGDGSSSSTRSEQSSNWSNPSGSIDSNLGIEVEQVHDTCDAVSTELASQYNKGIEEAMKFVPKFDKLFIGSESTIRGPTSLKPQKNNHFIGNETKGYDFGANMKLNDSELDVIEGRVHKINAVNCDDLVRNETMDKVLLCRERKYMEDVTTIREIFQKEIKHESQKIPSENLNTTKVGSKKQFKEGLVDLTYLLMSCAHAVFTNDHITANEMIKQIRKQSSLTGDWSQRLAFYMVDSLEARLAGIGSEIYRKHASKRITASDMLKAYRFYLAVCPYKRAAIYFSNQTILNTWKNKLRLHIIDFGILFGFEWPPFFEKLSNWKSTPHTIRITGIGTPQSGFRPCARVNDTGERLADYAHSFNIPFEYKGIASSNWENIRTEDFGVNKEEFLVVNYICKEILCDSATLMDSTRDHVLRTIKKLNPHVLILGVCNSSLNGPYFMSRFREVFYHFSSLFDMLDTTMPRDNPERRCIEKHLGQKTLNAIACEGSERVVRPEAYKHWQARITRVGFAQIPVDHGIAKRVKDVVKELYHKEFFVDEDNGWLLMGWKGRVMFAMSAWKPNED